LALIRATTRLVAFNEIQAQMRNANIQITMAINGRALVKRRVDELGKAFR